MNITGEVLGWSLSDRVATTQLMVGKIVLCFFWGGGLRV